MRWIWYRFFYRSVMRTMHRFNLHHTKTCYPDGDTMVWCQWCGLRAVVRRRDWKNVIDDRPASDQLRVEGLAE